MIEPIISCQGLRAGYGDVCVVRDLDLTVRQGEVVVLLGPNGAGKTTTLLTVAGLLPKLGGSVEVGGEPVNAERPHEMTRRGLAFVPDTRELVSVLTVRDNLRVAARKGGQTVDDILDLFPSLRARLKLKAGQLSGGEQQMLAMGRALMNRPKALVVDEMSMGLAPIIVEQLLEIIADVARQGHTGVLLVEQHVALALHAADRAYVIVHGEVSLQSDAADLRTHPDRLAQAYLGTTEAAPTLVAATQESTS